MFLTSQQRADFRSGRAAAIAKRYAHQYQPHADLMPTQTPIPRYLLIQVDCHRDDLGPRAEPVWTYLRSHHSARAAHDFCDRLRSEGRDDDFYLADLDDGTTTPIVDLPQTGGEA